MIASPIAQRVLLVAGSPERTVVVSIGQPEPDPHPDSHGDWICPVYIEGIADPGPHLAHGVDSLQALLLAPELIRKILDESGLSLTWLGDEPGHLCIPRTMAAYAFGPELAREIEQYIQHHAETYKMPKPPKPDDCQRHERS
jgi:hypothetical protein